MRVKKFESGTRLEVQWSDIVSNPAWQSKEEIDKATAVSVKTLGYFLQNKKKVLKLAHSVSADGESDSTLIPWTNIETIDVLEVNDGR